MSFWLTQKKNFYFLEMNTRLQVEHAITECITGIDIVQEMLRVAYGHKLQYKQDDIKVHGWAFESRVYAEDPYKGVFGLPSIGRLSTYVDPIGHGLENVRCDSGIEEGSDISIYYDPMICKLITYGPTRNAALDTMCEALDNYVIRGVTNNIPLLRDIITEKNFVDGKITTKYLAQTYPDGFKGKQLSAVQKTRLLAMSAIIYVKQALIGQVFKNSAGVFPEEIAKSKVYELVIVDGELKHTCVIQKLGDKFSCQVDETSEFLIDDSFNLNDHIIKAKINNNEQVTMQLVSREGNGNISMQYLGTQYKVKIYSKLAHQKLKYMLPKKKIDLSSVILSPMPGIVKSIAVEVGQQVIEGQEICVVEAMKMQNKLMASRTGKIKKINAKVNEQVEENKVLIELE